MERLGEKPGAARGGFLACLIGGHVLAVPLAHVGRLVEYERSAPPPLAHSWLGGLGQEGDSLFPSLALLATTPGARRGKGLLLSSGSLRFALEVDDVQGLVRLDGPADEIACQVLPLAGWSCPPGWLAPASGAAAFVLDVAAIVRTLCAVEAAVPLAGQASA